MASVSISKKLKRKIDADSTIATSDGACDDLKRTCTGKYSRQTFSSDLRFVEVDKLAMDYPLAAKVLKMETKYCDELMDIDYGSKVTHVYNPVDYAYKPHLEFYRKYCKESAKVLLIGENPGPFGGAQTGVSVL